ncbi:MAG: YihY/virulence factor BrkB family protein [Bacteroidales bacterium]|nr:YihY/virulence factor BrkB family protein [Bacteroidales bacterium]MBR1793769.1 YihY/virulence factor BrkB family protein [Bacteroidales bacterium]
MNLFQKAIHWTQVRIRWASIMIGRVIRFLTHDMWYLKMEDLSAWKARVVRDIKVVWLMLKVFADQKIGFQCTALAYQSMMSVVPFIAIGLFLTNKVGISDQFSAFLYANLSNQRLIEDLLQASDKIIATAESGLFGFISMFSFFWVVIWLMVSVRRVFNNVWRAEEKRNFFHVLGVGLGVIILAPFVIVLFFTGSVVYSTILDYIVPSGLFFSESLKSLLSWVLFAGGAILILSAMYKYVPAAHVRYRHALKAAAITGIVFAAVQYLYLETQVMVAKQNAIYGVLAAIPLFMIWLNLGWTIVLYGAELSYSFQNVNHLNFKEIL